MCVVDVQPCPVGENHVRGADLVRVDHRRGTAHSPQIEASGISQRRFDLVIPACALGPWHARCGGVGKHRLVEVRIGFADGSLGEDIPYSTSTPMIRCMTQEPM